MKLGIRFKNIAVRWFTNIFMLIAVFVTVAATGASFLYHSLYIERVKTLAEDYSYSFNALKNYKAETFEDAARELTSSFTYKNKVEVQLIDTSGRIFLTTTGFQPKDNLCEDYLSARQSGGDFYFEGKNNEGERIMSQTHVITGTEGEEIGGYRWLISVESVYRRTTYFVLIVIGVGLIMLALTAFSGLFFIGSIVRPIRTVGNTARKIASGDFESRIEIERSDEIGELCDAINFMASELAHTENMKNDFISSVSHELRTPLTAIRGWGETAKMSVGTDPELVKQGLDVVLSEADRLSNLVEDLLDFSRMQRGSLTMNAAPINVSLLVKAAGDMYTELAKKQGIELSYTYPKHESIVFGDADRLKQVFINIIDNAVKYTEKGGLVLIDQTEEEGCVRIAVKDTGVGIPAQDIDRVKEKFFKSNKTVRGNGIGLAVADEIVKQHKGLIFIESTEGVGSTVTVVLPLYEEVKPEPEPEVLLESIIEHTTPDENPPEENTADKDI